MTRDELLADLASRERPVLRRACEELAARLGQEPELRPELLERLRGDDPRARFGAAHVLFHAERPALRLLPALLASLELPDGDLRWQAAQMLAVLGPDGAGKTTLIQLLAGLLAPSDGTAVVAGVDIRRAETALAERIGYMSERFTLYGSLSVAENLAFFADLYGVRGEERARRTADLLRFSRLEAALDRRAGQLSGGMQ